jgi:predicted acylesterase/phospholipase RssA
VQSAHRQYSSPHGWLWLVALLPLAASAADPCAAPQARALVLGSGGNKGAFEAGAAYHLIVQRGCDFQELSGISVGAINAALLGQAASAADPRESLASLQRAADELIGHWLSLESTRHVLRTRPLGRTRLALFGLESIESFEPLRRFVRERVSLDRLRSGREVRVGVTSFVDGRYHEIVINAAGAVDPLTAHELIFSSAIVPVFGAMPRVAVPGAAPDGTPRPLADGGISHPTPVTSYFQSCRPAATASAAAACMPLTGAQTPEHPRTEQLFVVVTSPYERNDDLRPPMDTAQDVTDGRRILVRMLYLLTDNMHRDDIDDMLLWNDLLRWRAQAAAGGAALPEFPLGSYHRTAPGAPALPYEIALIAPYREHGDPTTIFEITPSAVRRQLFCGCIAADDVMQTEFGVAPLADQCAARFRGLEGPAGEAAVLTADVCR